MSTDSQSVVSLISERTRRIQRCGHVSFTIDGDHDESSPIDQTVRPIAGLPVLLHNIRYDPLIRLRDHKTGVLLHGFAVVPVLDGYFQQIFAGRAVFQLEFHVFRFLGLRTLLLVRDG